MTTMTDRRNLDTAADELIAALIHHARQHELYLEHGVDDDDVVAGGRHAAAYAKCRRALVPLVGTVRTREAIAAANRAVLQIRGF